MRSDVPHTDNPISDAGIEAYALSLHKTYMTEQWMGSHVYKVGDADTFKMFAILNPGRRQLTVKTASRDIANLLIHAHVAERHTHMPRGSWVMLLLDRLDADDVKERIETSYQLVIPGLTKTARKKFGFN
jgi:predicted DNA-binding protein (MmcQ/YjbR family)